MNIPAPTATASPSPSYHLSSLLYVYLTFSLI